MVLRIALGLVSFVAALVVFVWSKMHDGESRVVAGQVLSPTVIQYIWILLLLAGAFFVLAAAVQAVRKIVTAVALVSLLGTGSVAAFAPTSQIDWVREHGCNKEVTGLSAKALQECRS